MDNKTTDNQNYCTQEDFNRLSGELSGLHGHVTQQIEGQILALHEQLYTLKGKMQGVEHSQAERDAFNGQYSKHQIWRELNQVIAFEVYVETGTHVGYTTHFIAQKGKPVFSSEIHDGRFSEAQDRLKDFDRVEVIKEHSLDFLQRLISTEQIKNPAFVYLDAHWFDHLPLKEELELLGRSNLEIVVMIDDFKIPHDGGFRFDDYGNGNAITAELIHEEMERHGFTLFYPSMKSADDHMWSHVLKPSGTAVLARSPAMVKQLKKLRSLTQSGVDHSAPRKEGILSRVRRRVKRLISR